MQQAFEHRLPDGWSTPELVQDSIVAAGIELHRVGMAARSPAGEEITGAAVEIDRPPVARGYFELLERVSTLEAIACPEPRRTRTDTGDATGWTRPAEIFSESDEPARWRYARSNGVAIHDTWAAACERAHLELVERDRVLRAWYGETRAEPLRIPTGSIFECLEGYETSAFTFPTAPGVRFGDGVHVVGVFGFPQHPEFPLLLGYGARQSLTHALDAAIRESLQSLGFLWGEVLPQDRPVLAPTPAAHVEALLFAPQHAALKSWLQDGHCRFARASHPSPVAVTTYADLTPGWLGGLFVAKATCPQAAPLAFGDSPFVQHLPADLRAHPIP